MDIVDTGVSTVVLLIAIVFAIIPFAVWIWAIVDIVKSRFKSDTDKIVWLLVVLLFPLVGFILYLAIGRGQRL